MVGRDRPESDDLFRLALLVAMALAAAAAVLSQHANWFRQLAIAVAWTHVKPFAELAQLLPQAWSGAAPGKWLFAPAVFVDENLPTLLADASEHAFRLAMTASGRVAVLVYGPAFAILAVNASSVRCDLANRKVHNLESLLNVQAQHWPAAQFLRQATGYFEVGSGACAGRNATANGHSASRAENDRKSLLLPMTAGARETSGAESALRPETWLRSNGLAHEIDCNEQALRKLYDLPRGERVQLKEWDGLTGEEVCEVLETQLRYSWHGYEELSPLHRSLAALFALFHDFRSDDGNALLSRLAALAERVMSARCTMNEAIASDSGLDADISEILDSDTGKKLLAVASRHAWLGTAFIGMLHAARKDRGVLASASFMWLKHEDRALWYALNSSGNAAAVVEAAGVLAHYRAERQIRRPLYKPAVYQAARAFVDSYLDISPQRLTHRKMQAEFRKPVGFRLEEIAQRTGRAEGWRS